MTEKGKETTPIRPKLTHEEILFKGVFESPMNHATVMYRVETTFDKYKYDKVASEDHKLWINLLYH